MPDLDDLTLITDEQEFIPQPSMKQNYDLGNGAFPLRAKALIRLGEYKIVEIHDDGDLTVQSDGQLFVVTTDGKIFKQMVAA